MDEETFWKRVSVGSDNDCWIWTGSRTKQGYGNLRIKQKTVYAHRYIYELRNGKIPDGLVVCHKCDNPACVNPSHLFLGTQGDNVRDRDEKGRRGSNPPRGESHHNSKLTEKDVAEIRKMLADGQSIRKIASKFGVTSWTIGSIAVGKTWKNN
jgi:hypothetical protein